MRNAILVLFVLSLALIPGVAQITEAEVIYEDKRNIHKTLPPEMEQWKDRIPEFRSVKKLLLINENETLYTKYVAKEGEKEEVLDAETERGRRWRNRMNRDENKMYANIDEKIVIEEREFFGKTFLIDGAEEPLAWKITGEQKQVGSYLCMKAIYQDTTQSIEAWFTPMIPVASGPDKYNQLPGLILHMDFNDGERTITALEVIPKEIDDSLVERPVKGDKITREEFDEMVEKKTAEMREMYGSSRGRRFIRRN